MAMQAGANGLIIGNYLTTMGRSPAQDMQMLKDLGFDVVETPPTRPRPEGHGRSQTDSANVSLGAWSDER